MTDRLAGTANYYTISDFVEVVLFYGDATTLHPECVKNGNVKLLHNKAPIASVEIDKYSGNEDGSFRVFFNHPTTTRRLSVRAEIETYEDGDSVVNINVRSVQQDMQDLASNPASEDEEEMEF